MMRLNLKSVKLRHKIIISLHGSDSQLPEQLSQGHCDILSDADRESEPGENCLLCKM